jgi:predicted ATPase
LGELALIGRAAETEVIDRLLADAFAGRSGVLVLTGEAGAGKSALLAYARARADGMGVLQTVGVQSEAEIEFAALYQLLRPALDGMGWAHCRRLNRRRWEPRWAWSRAGPRTDF